MSGIRVLVGTRKGAFILTSDGKRKEWEVSGPHFAGWEIYHLKGSPADPNRIYASQTSGWFGQVMQRSSDGGAHLGAGGEQVRLRRHPRDASVVRRDTASLGVQARLAPGAFADGSGDGVCRRRGRRPVPVGRRRAGLGGASRSSRRQRQSVGARRRRHGPPHHRARPAELGAYVHRHFGSRRLPYGRLWPDVAPDQQRIEVGAGTPRCGRGGRPLRAPNRDAPVAPRTSCSCRSTGT